MQLQPVETDKNQKIRDFSFHKFPKHKEYRKIWISKCKRKDKLKPETAVICSHHFLAEDFIEDKMNKLLKLKERKLLKKDAVPSLHLPLEKFVVPSLRKSLWLQRKTQLRINGNV